MIYQEESPEFKTLSGEYHKEFPPATPEERYLVNILVHSVWQQRQCFRIENALWEAEGKDATVPSLHRILKDLEPLSRLDESANKRFHSALTQLLKIRDARAKQIPPAKSTGLFQVPKRKSVTLAR